MQVTFTDPKNGTTTTREIGLEQRGNRVVVTLGDPNNSAWSWNLLVITPEGIELCTSVGMTYETELPRDANLSAFRIVDE